MKAAENFITIVSGLPRSGTSLMMQMLDAGGLPALTDGLRQADESNPRGYLEHERVKRLRTETDFSWLDAAGGRALKIIHFLLPHLPTHYSCRVIMMRRSIDEVVASQRVMLRRQALPGAALPDARLGQILLAQMQQTEQWLERHGSWPVCSIDYGELLVDPAAKVRVVQQFLGLDLDANAMIRVVDATLWRQRTIALPQ